MDPFDSRRDDDLLTKARQLVTNLTRHQKLFMDKITPYLIPRWVFSITILLIFVCRVLFLEKCPKLDPDFQANREDLDPDSGPSLPTRVNDEFRPFIRRLPEYKFWFMGTRATLIATFLSFFDMFDVPVFWPILVLYFFVLTFLTLRRQIQHMYKHHYVPWTTENNKVSPITSHKLEMEKRSNDKLNKFKLKISSRLMSQLDDYDKSFMF